MPANMLEWAAREPGLTLAFVYILYEWFYTWMYNRDKARCARREAAHMRMLKHLPRDAVGTFRNPPNAFMRIWPHAFIQACIWGVLAWFVLRAVWQAL